MSVEERILNLEQIAGALAQLAQKADRRLDQGEARLAQVDDRLDKLTTLAVRFDERLDALAAAQENTERKLAALADAQIRTEDSLAALTMKMDALTVKVDALTDSQSHTDARLDRLAALVERNLNGGDSQQ